MIFFVILAQKFIKCMFLGAYCIHGRKDIS